MKPLHISVSTSHTLSHTTSNRKHHQDDPFNEKNKYGKARVSLRRNVSIYLELFWGNPSISTSCSSVENDGYFLTVEKTRLDESFMDVGQKTVPKSTQTTPTTTKTTDIRWWYLFLHHCNLSFLSTPLLPFVFFYRFINLRHVNEYLSPCRRHVTCL